MNKKTSRQDKAKMLNNIVTGRVTISELIPNIYIVFIQNITGVWQTDNGGREKNVVPDNDIEKYIANVLQPMYKYKNIIPIKISSAEYEQISSQIEADI
jgi:hypothetical protein